MRGFTQAASDTLRESALAIIDAVNLLTDFAQEILVLLVHSPAIAAHTFDLFLEFFTGDRDPFEPVESVGLSDGMGSSEGDDEAPEGF